MLNNHYVRTPEELFKTHEDWVYGSIIAPEKQARIVEVLSDFSNDLYSKITEDRELCSKFYLSTVRGFTVKMISAPSCVRHIVERTITFDEIYLAATRNGIGPLMPNTVALDENGEIIKWLDPNFRKYICDLGWHCGILHDNESFGEKIVIYAIHKKD